jgi:hypothetical protein
MVLTKPVFPTPAFEDELNANEGLGFVSQTRPFLVIEQPPSEEIIPPKAIELPVADPDF